LQFTLFGGGLVSELILASNLLKSSELRDTGIILVLARLIHIYPTLIVIMSIQGWLKNDIFGITNWHVSPSYLKSMEEKHFFANSKPYGIVLLFSLQECSLLRHLPWYLSDFSELSGYPNNHLLRHCLLAKMIQLIVTLSCQVTVAVNKRANLQSAALAFLYIQLSITCLNVSISMLDVILRRSLLGQSDLSTDAKVTNPAAVKGGGDKEDYSDFQLRFSSGMELGGGVQMTSNPMLKSKSNDGNDSNNTNRYTIGGSNDPEVILLRLQMDQLLKLKYMQSRHSLIYESNIATTNNNKNDTKSSELSEEKTIINNTLLKKNELSTIDQKGETANEESSSSSSSTSSGNNSANSIVSVPASNATIPVSTISEADKSKALLYRRPSFARSPLQQQHSGGAAGGRGGGAGAGRASVFANKSRKQQPSDFDLITSTSFPSSSTGSNGDFDGLSA